MQQRLSSTLAVALLLQSVLAQYDPVANFCKRLDHQSAIVNGKLYIDGGREVFTNYAPNGTDIGPHIIGPNEYLLSLDLTKGWSASDPLPIITITKNTSTPFLSRGALFPKGDGSDNFFLFGGTVAYDNKTFANFQLPQPEGNPIIGYGGAADSWSLMPETILRACSGSAAVLQDGSKAFYFNGEQDNGSSEESINLLDTTKFMNGMIEMDLNNPQSSGGVKNLSTSAVSSLARVRGSMVHVPLPGSKGVLVLLAGGEKSSLDSQHDWKGTLVSMQTVQVFDVGSISASSPDGKWYKQTTSGVAPSPRLDACITVMAAPDNSSYNVYMYGGRDGLNAYFDERTLPSFKWVKGYSGPNPRYSLTCHVIGPRQMMTIGGSENSTVTARCDPVTQGIRILDMTLLNWDVAFNPNVPAYQLPMAVVNVIGGNQSGSANITSPTGGFQQKGLQELFHPGTTSKDADPSTNGSSGAGSSSKKKTPVGAIVGVVIGVLVLLAAIAALVFVLLRRKRQARQAAMVKDAAAGNEVYEISNGSLPLAATKLPSPAVVHEIDAPPPKSELFGDSPMVAEMDASSRASSARSRAGTVTGGPPTTTTVTVTVTH
ncbi:hypothetical protein BT63DRAFT_452532 [Microthyrium microscopicum]|uniref:Kelch repeat protein n=1 Tax=Microthyrium microscopicum TaxID=703497 RepID=A0A6A6UIB4_9PEZI|nr:hypothetical protein BT63DRAFT_452532 [Microthyrium microscopicum]